VTNVISKDTLVPISFVLTLAGSIYWGAKLEAKVLALEIKSQDRSSMDAEIVSQLRSFGLDMQDVRVDQAKTKVMVENILKILEGDRK
jgi:hypothetical protein